LLKLTASPLLESLTSFRRVGSASAELVGAPADDEMPPNSNASVG
jgi:hypothetical protein